MGKIWLVNKGHGGMINNIYQTAPDKMFKHPNGEVAYEGVFNRICGDRLINFLKAEDRKYIDICPTELDLPLSLRCKYVNDIYEKYGRHSCVLLELHANAGGGAGFEIWTGPGQTKSDVYAKWLFDIVKKDVSEMAVRSGYSSLDPDPDKEAAFYMLTKTNCPAILPEFGFFDNWDDWQKMMDFNIREKYIQSLMKLIRRVDVE